MTASPTGLPPATPASPQITSVLPEVALLFTQSLAWHKLYKRTILAIDMVLESLITPSTAERHPLELFFIGFLYNSFAIILSLSVFRSYASLTMVFLTAIACVPLFYSAIKQQEFEDRKNIREVLLLKEHSRVLVFLMFLCLGIIASVLVWYLIIPFLSSVPFLSLFFTPDTSTDLFGIQEGTITSLTGPLGGQAINPGTEFLHILKNNLKVLLFCLLFSFFYGMGAIFILVWNASLIGVAMGSFVKSMLPTYAGFVAPLVILRYLTHGIFELGGYFAAGLAGGIISIAFIRHDYGSAKFKNVLKDSLDLILVSIALLVVGALIEAFITPALF